MKIVCILIVAFIALVSADEWFRVANHLGTVTPSAIKFKACALPNVYVNAKNSGRIGFGFDLPAVVNVNGGGICTGGCGSGKRVIDAREDDDSDPNALYATDSAVNFHVYWSRGEGGDLGDPNRILTRVTNGDVAYQMGADTALSVASNSGSGYVSVGSLTARRYPEATFQFLDDNRVISQNWYFEQSNPNFACTSGGDANDLVQVYHVASVNNGNVGDLSFKSRVRFEFAEEATPLGKVSVQVVWNSATQRFEKHVRSTDGASFSHTWLTGIHVRVTAEVAGNQVVIMDDNSVPVTEFSQSLMILNLLLLL